MFKKHVWLLFMFDLMIKSCLCILLKCISFFLHIRSLSPVQKSSQLHKLYTFCIYTRFYKLLCTYDKMSCVQVKYVFIYFYHQGSNFIAIVNYSKIINLYMNVYMGKSLSLLFEKLHF